MSDHEIETQYQVESCDPRIPQIGDPFPLVQTGPGGEYRRDYTPAPVSRLHYLFPFTCLIVAATFFLIGGAAIGFAFCCGMATAWPLTRG